MLHQPSLATLRAALPEYGKFRFDVTLQAARDAIGEDADAANPLHAAHLREWLNRWICHIPYPLAGQQDMFATALGSWWMSSGQSGLPARGSTLAGLTDHELEAIAATYANLRPRPAASYRNGRTRSIGPTATAKVLYFIRPESITPWDNQIARRTGGGYTESAFLQHLTLCRRWAAAIEEEGKALGLTSAEIGPAIGRPKSSVAKLIDEWLYATVTRGFG